MIAKATQDFLLALARRTLINAVTGRALPCPALHDLPEETTAPAACFATLTRHGNLRGCIGQLRATEPMWKAIIEATSGAALRDPRFLPVAADEVPGLTIALSVLSKPERLLYTGPEELLQAIRPEIDGLVLTIENRTSTFLPKVWKKIPNKTEFLAQLALKAVQDRNAWHRSDAVVSVYQTTDFSE